MTENCPMRHENGNCIPAGGFCTANKNICEALLNAYRMGKAQLSQEGTTSDTISRQAVIDELRKFKAEIIPYEKARIYVEETVETMYDRIVELPTVQPEPQEGEWVDGRCNKCGGQAPFWVMSSTYYKSDFCPCCGAKMKGATT